MISRFTKMLPSLAELAGYGAIAAGLGLVYVPAGIVAVGIALWVIGIGMEKRAPE